MEVPGAACTLHCVEAIDFRFKSFKAFSVYSEYLKNSAWTRSYKLTFLSFFAFHFRFLYLKTTSSIKWMQTADPSAWSLLGKKESFLMGWATGFMKVGQIALEKKWNAMNDSWHFTVIKPYIRLPYNNIKVLQSFRCQYHSHMKCGKRALIAFLWQIIVSCS